MPPHMQPDAAGGDIESFTATQMLRIQELIRDAVNQAVAGVVHATSQSQVPSPCASRPYTSPYSTLSQLNQQQFRSDAVLSQEQYQTHHSLSDVEQVGINNNADDAGNVQHQPTSRVQNQGQVSLANVQHTEPACRAPTQTIYPSRDIMMASLQNHSAREGYAIVIRRSRKSLGRRPAKVYLKCDRGGNYTNSRGLDETTRKRNIASRLIGCPFKAIGIEKPDGTWELRISDAAHNHDPSADLANHPSHRRAFLQDNDALREDIEEMTRQGIAPRKIMESLKDKLGADNVPLVITDLYNCRQRYRRSLMQQDEAAEQMQQEALLTHA